MLPTPYPVAEARHPVRRPPADEPPPDTAADQVLGWLSLYLPSWGSSVILHAALLILAAFVAWQTVPADAFETPAYSAFELTPSRAVRERDAGLYAERPGREMPKGLFEPNPYRFNWTKDLHPRDGIGRLDRNAPTDPILGVGGDPIGGGPGSFGLFDGGRGIIFDIPPEGARKIVYIVDKSGSMTDSLGEYVKPELKRSIAGLDDQEGQEFHVIFFSSGPAVEMPTRRLVSATETNKRFAYEFIDGVIAERQTDPTDALQRAFAVRPEVIYLLTDGEFDRAIIDLVKRLNVGGRVMVNTICFIYEGGAEVLQEIARQNNGQYKLVREADLAAIQP